jgi:hypothetical protein
MEEIVNPNNVRMGQFEAALCFASELIKGWNDLESSDQEEISTPHGAPALHFVPARQIIPPRPRILTSV